MQLATLERGQVRSVAWLRESSSKVALFRVGDGPTQSEKAWFRVGDSLKAFAIYTDLYLSGIHWYPLWRFGDAVVIKEFVHFVFMAYYFCLFDPIWRYDKNLSNPTLYFLWMCRVCSKVFLIATYPNYQNQPKPPNQFLTSDSADFQLQWRSCAQGQCSNWSAAWSWRQNLRHL